MSRCPSRTLATALCQSARPGHATALGEAVEGANRLAAVGGDAEVDVAIAADLLGRDVHLDDPGVGRDQARAAPAREQTQTGAQHEHDIGGARPGGAGDGQVDEAASAERVIGRQQARAPCRC